jgi:hypothetical protein
MDHKTVRSLLIYSGIKQNNILYEINISLVWLYPSEKFYQDFEKLLCIGKQLILNSFPPFTNQEMAENPA